MKVAIDARKLHDFGIGTYIRNLLRHLARLDTRTEYVLLCQKSDLDTAAQLGPNFRTVLEPSPNYSIREQIHVPWVLLRERPDVYHAPHYVLPPAVRCRSIVTIHDTIHLTFPQYLPHRLAYGYARASMWAAASGTPKSSNGVVIASQAFSVKVTVRDPKGLSASRTFTLTVRDTKGTMPNLIGDYGDGGAGKPNISSISAPSNDCSQTDGSVPNDTIWRQGVAPGSVITYGQSIKYWYRNDSVSCPNNVGKGW